jgi:hypothetical protein
MKPFRDDSPRVEANNYALTVTSWLPCQEGRHRAQLDWNYKRGQSTGTLYTPTVPVFC